MLHTLRKISWTSLQIYLASKTHAIRSFPGRVVPVKVCYLRSLEPEVMMLRSGESSNLSSLPFLSVHVPLRKAEFGVTELRRLVGYASVTIGEHLLTMHVMFRLVGLLEGLRNHIDPHDASQFESQFNRLFELSGGVRSTSANKPEHETTAAQTFRRIKATCEEEIMRVRQYYARLPFSKNIHSYLGSLTGYLDFIVPLATVVCNFKTFGRVPVYVMLDDADNLPRHLQRVLNSWVSTRSTHVVCLKITT